MHYFDGGNCIGRFPLATNEIYINKTTNEKITSTEWHNLVVRNKAAEICEKYLSKGDKIYVEGRIKSRQWQTEDGVTKYTTEIQVTEFTFLTTKKDTELNKTNASGVPDSIKSSNFDSQNDSHSDEGMPF
jgi:single-strand DNA-binding protein